MKSQDSAFTLPRVTVTGQRRTPPSDDVSIIVGGRTLSGWTDIRITRGIERIPNDFELSYTDVPELKGLAMLIKPGDPCEVKIGPDLVITGYIDRVMPSISPTQHRIVATGRGRCQDLVDCAANYRGGQMVISTVDQIATILAFPYEIGIETSGDMGAPIPAFNISHGETPFQIIETICRFRQLLAYELPNGNLMLTRTFTRKAGSGFAEGVNIQSGGAVWGMDQRYSDYWVYVQSLDVLQDPGIARGDLIGKCSDPSVGRFRLRKIVAEASGNESGANFAQDRATWEASRRAGRSAEIRLTSDSWRDVDGHLFEPGMLVDIDAPSLYMTSGPEDLNSKFLIGELTYRKDASGTSLDVVAMSPLAFNPQPTVLTRGVSRDILNLPRGLGQP